jgi:hypothetical protein
MKRIATIVIFAFILAPVVLAQNAETGVDKNMEPIQGKSQTEVVDEVWRLATQGELLTSDGWSKVCGLFTKPAPFPGDKEIRIVSNDWGPSYEYKSRPESTDVALGYTDLGKINSVLQYAPPTKTEFVKTAFLYRLVAVPAYLMMYGPDGKTLIEKRSVGHRVWQVEGSPGTP